MKKILPIVSIILVLFTILSCDSSLQPMEEGNVNYYIYPYLEFELSYDSTYYIAYVVEGAKLTSVSIPGEKHTDFGPMPVKVFGGFRNPEDAVNLKTVYIDVNVDRISDGAFDYAYSLESVITTGTSDGQNWAKLPSSLTRDGYHFHGWKVGNTIYDGESTIAINPDTPVAQPYFVALEYHEAVSPTCTEEGSIEHWKCPECGKLFTDSHAENSVNGVSVPPTGHLYPLVWVEPTEPTCLKEGNIGHFRCDRCGSAFSDESGTLAISDTSIPKLDYHVSDEILHMNATHHWYQCIWCGTEIDMYEHVWGEWVITVHATEHKKGSRYHDCLTCGYRVTVDIPEHDHIEGEILEKHKASCTEGAYYIEKCGNPDCGEIVRFEIEHEPALGHVGYIVPFVDSTCAKTGTVQHFHCTRCKKDFLNQSDVTPLETVVIPLKDHKWSTKWEYNDSTHYHVCTVCETAQTEGIPHVYDQYVTEGHIAAESTCQHPNQYYVSCICGKNGTETFTVDDKKGNHKYSVAKPDANDPNYHYYYCEYEGCGERNPDSKESHVFIPSENGKKCKICGYEVLNVDGGFDFPILDPTPRGHMEVLSKEGTVWTFVFVNDKPSYPPKELIWSVDNVVIERKDVVGVSDYQKASFSVNAEYPMTYKVMCRYVNDVGSGSDTIVINGG